MPDSTRQLKLANEFGLDLLEIQSVYAEERLSELFSITMNVISQDNDIDFLPLLGAGASAEVCGFDGATLRYFHGQLFDADFLGADGAGWSYRLTLRPFLYRLGQNLDYRVFQNLTAVDIIKQIFSNRGCTDIKYNLSGAFRTREYCVQYRESDLDFICRLMEEEGIYYFFEHAVDKHTLVLCNGLSSHSTVPGYDTLPMIANEGSRVRTEDHMWTWVEHVSSQTQDTARLRDYNFTMPSTDLTAVSTVATGHKGASTEVMDYHGRYTTAAEGEPYAKVMLESLRARRQVYRGDGDARAVGCGNLFTLSQHETDRLNQEYLVSGITFHAEAEQYRAGGGSGREAGDEMTVEALPSSTQFRAPLRTPRPVARGPESAIVTGPSGEVIFTDQWGRVKVQFYWDRYGKPDNTSSCWLRVSEPSAGQNFGHIALPRVGQEVVVDFMNGDPDRPFVAGRLYNATQTLGWAMPGNKTRSHWRSQTVGKVGQDYSNAEKTPSGAGFNEIYFEDNGGAEMVYLQAQRDMQSVIQRDDEHLVWRNQHQRVGYNRNWEVKNNETSVVEQGDQTHTVQSGKRTTQIQMNDTLTVKQGDLVETVEMGNQTTTIKMGSQTTDVKMGDISVKADLGSITLEAMQQIVLKVGGSSITLTQTGISIQGMITVDIQAAAQATMKAAIVQLQGEGEVAATAPIIMLN